MASRIFDQPDHWRSLRSFSASGSDDEDDNDAKSNKSDDDNEEDDKAKVQAGDGSTPPPEPQVGSEKQQEEEQQHKKSKKQSRQDRDAEFEARIAELPLRVEPVGLDRHHRKYWLLSGRRDCVYTVMSPTVALYCVQEAAMP